jgi:hypothetical protein
MGWETPNEFSDAEQAFQVHVLELIPPWDKIPDDFKNYRHPAVKTFNTWMFGKFAGGVNFAAVKGIDPEAAFLHCLVVMKSYQLKHEHKKAAVAFLINRWFTRIWAGDEVYWEAPDEQET